MATRRPQRRPSSTRMGGSGADERVSMARGAQQGGGRRPIRTIIVALVIVAALLVVVLLGFLVLSNTPAFTIASIDAEATEHLTPENIAKLADVEEGTTLLNIDEGVVTENLRRNPWVGEVSFAREFPDRLKIVVTERKVDCLVKMSAGSVCWCLGDDNVWIEPVNLSVADGQSATDVALALAQDMGAILITDVPTSMSPEAGSAATDEVLSAIASYRELFSSEFAADIVCFSAQSLESISCTLKSGVEVSLGSPTNIETKEAVVKQILAEHPNQITYINVRVPSQPSYRKLGTESVEEGTGVTIDLDADSLVDGDGSGDGVGADGGADAQRGEGDGDGTSYAEDGSFGEGEQGTGKDVDTSELILGGDGNYYTYEEYYGLD